MLNIIQIGTNRTKEKGTILFIFMIIRF